MTVSFGGVAVGVEDFLSLILVGLELFLISLVESLLEDFFELELELELLELELELELLERLLEPLLELLLVLEPISDICSASRSISFVQNNCLVSGTELDKVTEILRL